MLKKILIGIFLLLVIGLLASDYFFPRFEDSYDQHITLRLRSVISDLKKMEIRNICTGQSLIAECFSNYVKNNIGIRYGSDMAPVLPYAFKICKNNLDCVYETLDKIIDSIHIKNLDLIKKGNRNHPAFQPLLKLEIGILDKLLRGIRKKYLDQWNQESKIEQKGKLLIFIKNIDRKINEINTN